MKGNIKQSGMAKSNNPIMKTNNKINFIKKLGIQVDDEGRCNITNTELQKLKPMPQGNRYVEVVLNT